MFRTRSIFYKTVDRKTVGRKTIRGQNVKHKLRALRAARVLKQGGCVAHATSTLPGIAADPNNQQAIRQLQRFKQRAGPFLLLADSIHTALRQARYISPALRRLARSSWPGAVSLIIPAKPGLHAACYEKSSMALRVDASQQTRCLAKACGGLLLSSSLNRSKQPPCKASLGMQLRLHVFVNDRLTSETSSGKASQIMRVWRNDCTLIRA
ncbi:MAG: Sua5/YciO/YrdC/YwlC family protein [Mariprofundus sp.]|nr:Sua5/YciO/YrdC/YwlC family protein [Mariprofundus sp.]